MTNYSRLVVKNLPSSATEIKVKELFAAKGTITDVQLKRFDDGKFRHFAFVGFKTAEQAEVARDYFDNTFFGQSKMKVEICYPLNDPKRPKPWSKHTKAKLDEEFQKTKKDRKKKREEDAAAADEDEASLSLPKKIKKKEEEIFEKAKNDPEFLEFLEVHSKKQAKWGNDTVLDTLEKMVSTKSKKSEKQKSDDEAEQGEDDVEEEEEETKKTKTEKKPPPDDSFFTVKLRDLPKKTKKKDIKAFFSPLIPKSIRVPPNLRGFAYVGFLTEKEQKKALSKNKSMLLGNQISVRPYISRVAVTRNVEAKTSRWQTQTEELLQQVEGVEESGRIYVRNLSYTVTEDDLRQEFEKFGPVTEVHLPVDRVTRSSKGFAFISFLLPEQASKAFNSLDGSTFQGRMLHLLPAKSKDEENTDGSKAGSSYKREKEAKLKKSASSAHNWNSLFLGINAVGELASEKYGVSREQLLMDRHDTEDERISSAGVRLALAETELVSETKKFLEANGVNLEAFEGDGKNAKAERSTTTILVKNLTAGTNEEELREAFEKHGVVARIVMPPSGISAIVEFMVPAEARIAFKRLAYSKFKNMPLYLEWAPVGVFRFGADGTKLSTPQKKISEEEVEKEKQPKKNNEMPEIHIPTTHSLEPLDENMVPEPGTTLFVKNLNFNSTEEQIKRHFSALGHVYAATIARKKDPKNPGQTLSQGFGFVQFYRAKDANLALSTLNQSMLNNHLLELKMSSRTLQSDAEVKESEETKKGTKILVRNVPFQASEEEVVDLFKVFGKLKAVRMPKKIMGESQHRGFAFIDFFVEANAKAAFETLSKSTHLYGRRLVLEWAQKDATVDELREKVAKQYNLGSSSSSSSGPTSTKKQLKRYFDTEGGKSKDSATADGQEDDE